MYHRNIYTSFNDLQLFRKNVLRKIENKINISINSPGKNPGLMALGFTKDFDRGLVEKEIEKDLNWSLPFINNAHDYSWAQNSLTRQARQLEGDLGHDQNLVLGNPLFEQSKEQILQAKILLKEIFPEAYKRIEEIVTAFVFFQAPSYWSSTDPAAFGALFLNPKKHWTLAHMIESLLHESGHLDLMVIQTFDPLLKNPKFIKSSPLRVDPRPLNGILHAVFVLTRMCEGLLKMFNKTGCKTSLELFNLNLKRLKEGIKTLEKSAKFTQNGEHLFKSCQDFMHRS